MEYNPWITNNNYPQEIVDIKKALDQNPNLREKILWDKFRWVNVLFFLSGNEHLTFPSSLSSWINIPESFINNNWIISIETDDLKNFIALKVIDIIKNGWTIGTVERLKIINFYYFLNTSSWKVSLILSSPN
jgi:hypothetical protein